MEGRERTRLSRRLSYHLRHDPAAAGVTLDAAGWVPVDDLLAGMPGVGRRDLEAAVGDNPRFEISPDGTRIRARYGHSVDVDPAHAPATPPPTLYHGTVADALPAITAEGLRPMGRRQVHLSGTLSGARRVGGRRGRPVVIEVDAAGLVTDGFEVARAAPDVWLVDRVPAARLGRCWMPDGTIVRPAAPDGRSAYGRRQGEDHVDGIDASLKHEGD